ncbi:MAG: NAD(P)/FAD-dependent oxidoreductase [Haliscomenobacter sp.]|nr:NAD(P)/FAD-dependent oxidoreductase [Haliscomenobacter sp.]
MPYSYKRQKPEGVYDVVIIGSGMSGMGLAAILAKEGKRCLVLERHYTPGGFTHVFKRRDFEWDVGIHYIGDVQRKNALLRKAFDYITEEQLDWADMGDVYDRIIFGSRTYDFVKGTEAFRANMKGYFPDARDQAAIDQYLSLIRQASSSGRGLFMTRAMPGLLRRIAGPWVSRQSRRFYSRTTREVMQGLTSNEELIGVLTGQFGDYGLPPAQSSFMMHAMVARHYLNGAAYPVGGSARIFDTVEPVIEAAGGAVFVSAEVERILTSGKHITGVRMADGTEITAPVVVSSAGVHVTYNQLLRDEKTTAPSASQYNRIAPSAAHLCLYLGLEGTPEDLGLTKTNLWIYPDNPNHDENLERYLANPDQAELPLLYASFPAAKDPDFQRRYPGRSTIELITLGTFERFKAWETAPWKNRGEAYDQLKASVSQRMLDRFFDVMPQLKGKITYQELSTPLSTRHFVNYPQGEIYGLEHTPKRFASREISVYTPFKGLYLTGQDLISCGIAGALSSAMVTASVLTRKNIIQKIAL